MKNKSTDKEIHEMISQKTKNKKSKRKFSTGGVFDINDLNEDEQARYEKMSPNEQNAFIKNKQNEIITSTASKEYSKDKVDNGTLIKDVTDLVSSASSSSGGSSTTADMTTNVGGIIGTIAGVSKELAGEEDKYGKSDTDAQAFAEGISDIGSASEAATYYLKQGGAEGNSKALGSFLMPGVSEIFYQDDMANDLKKAEENMKKSLGQLSYYESKKFAKGGKVEKPTEPTEPAENKELLQKLLAVTPEIETELNTKEPRAKETSGYIEVPTGRNYRTGEMEYQLKKPRTESSASFTPNESRILSDTSRRALAVEAGIDPAEYDTKNKTDRNKSLEETMNYLNEKYSTEGRKFGLGETYDKKPTLVEYILNSNKTQQAYKEGGEVTGKGTGKSDSVNASIPIGSFIVPADANEEVVRRIKKIMGYDDAKVKQSDGIDVKLSDGELYIPPQDVEKVDAIVKEMGYESGLNELAPNAKTKLQSGQGYAEGYAGTIGGAAQILAGLLEGKNNKEPKNITPHLLKELSTEVRKRATYGMNPYERTEAENSMQRNIEMQKAMIKEASNGSIDMYLNNVAALGTRSDQSRLSLEATSSKLQDDKTKYADDVYMDYIKANENEFNQENQKYLMNEQTVSELIDAGISNVIGQSQYNKYTESLLTDKERAKLNSDKQAKKDKRKNSWEDLWRKEEEFSDKDKNKLDYYSKLGIKAQ